MAFFPAQNLVGQAAAVTVLNQLQPMELSSFTYFEDPSGTLNADEVSQRQSRFVEPAQGAIAFGYTASHYWVAFTIHNQTSEATWYLLPSHPLLRAEVYRIEDNGTVVKEPSLEERYAVSRLHVPPQVNSRFLVRVTSGAALSLQFELFTEPALSQRLHHGSTFLSAVVGCFLAMLLYNLFLYIILRDQNYLFYLVFAVFNCHLDLMTVNFPNGIWSWFGLSWWDIVGPYRIMGPLTTLLFARSFLHLKEAHPLVDRCVLAYLGGLVLLIIANFSPSAQLMSLTDIYFLFGILLLFYIGFHRLKDGFKPARFYLGAVGTFLIGVTVCLMQMLGWLPSRPWTINAIVVAHGLEMILMSLALGGRFKLIYEEKLRAEVTVRVKSHLLRTISHDIANPLTIVKAHSRRLLATSPGNKPLESIVKAVSIIEDIMRFVQKTEYVDQVMRMPLTPVSVQEVFASLAFLFEEKAQEKGIRLEFHLEHPGLAVQAEKTSLSNEVMGNLLSNAIKFSKSGQVIRVAARTHNKDVIMISVEDRGVGMSPEVLKTLFDPHQNRSQKGTQGEQGIGYGMPLAKAFLDAYGARIEVESLSAHSGSGSSGTIFRIFILAAPMLQGT
ncbi:sensor histidine kinase [Oligoflexus tunisiensis]|uniref:sensor histidine kinase n=1 Tax=Oligoflexus tunisiensis TaxID=708132 RepID=UPI001C407157|nr:sensor histidine kinase [Oligoflexus tunisiensis]